MLRRVDPRQEAVDVEALSGAVLAGPDFFAKILGAAGICIARKNFDDQSDAKADYRA